MSVQLTGTVTRRSNGTLEIQSDDARGVDRIVLHESALSSKALPAMGDRITLTIAVTEPVAASVPASNALASAATASVLGEAVPLPRADRRL